MNNKTTNIVQRPCCIMLSLLSSAMSRALHKDLGLLPQAGGPWLLPLDGLRGDGLDCEIPIDFHHGAAPEDTDTDKDTEEADFVRGNGGQCRAKLRSPKLEDAGSGLKPVGGRIPIIADWLI